MKRSHDGGKKVFKIILFIVTGVFVLFVFLSGPKGTVRLVQLSLERDRVDDEIQTLKRDNIRIQKDIDRYLHDQNAVEDEARRQLGFVKKGEVVYRFSSRPKGVKEP